MTEGQIPRDETKSKNETHRTTSITAANNSGWKNMHDHLFLNGSAIIVSIRGTKAVTEVFTS